MSNTDNAVNIPKPVNYQPTPGEIETNQCIQDCRRALMNYDGDELKESLLTAISNTALDNESRKAIINEIKTGRKNMRDEVKTDGYGLKIKNARDLIVKSIIKPAQLIHGILYQGGKMSYNADSKMGKTWSLLHLGISLGDGLDWFGFKTTKSRVLFINPELQDFSFEDRIQTLARNMTGAVSLENLDYITARGQQLSSDNLLDLLETRIEKGQYGAIILDSIYKLYPQNTEENSSSDVGRFLGQLEKLAVHSGAAVIYSHHYSKGNQANKSAIDRSSGAGAWGRDPDSIISVTEHDKENCYTVEFNLRDFKKVEPITIRVDWPNVSRDNTLDPKKLKTTKFTAKYDKRDILKLISQKPYSAKELQEELQTDLGMSQSAFYTFWKEVKKIPGVSETNKQWSYIIPAVNPANN